MVSGWLAIRTFRSAATEMMVAFGAAHFPLSPPSICNGAQGGCAPAERSQTAQQGPTAAQKVVDGLARRSTGPAALETIPALQERRPSDETFAF